MTLRSAFDTACVFGALTALAVLSFRLGQLWELYRKDNE